MDLLTERKLKNINLIFQVLTPLISIVLIGFATYITIRLAPLYQNIDSLIYRVQAIEEDRKSVPEFRQRMVILETNNKNMQEDIKEIKDNVKQLTNFFLK